jgi:hypothetical protein
MLAWHCSQIARQENTLGRHYSRFQPIQHIESKQYQSLAHSRKAKIAIGAVQSANFG